LNRAITKYNLTTACIHNWDEKGFVLGQASATQRIMSAEALRTGRIKWACQDSSREFVSLLASVCADSTALPTTLIYKGKSNDLQDTWLQDFEEQEIAYFAASANGWTDNSLGLQWLEKVFDPYTKTKAGNRRRLLIVDGHSSHVNMRFIEAADRLRIIILILPPHSTHRLQPLDVGLFSPLATAYTKELNNLMFSSTGLVSMSKRMFYRMFKVAYTRAFTERNITSAFQKTGIWPFNPEIVIATIRAPLQKPVPIGIPEVKTPMTCRAVRRAQKAYGIEPCRQNLELIFRATSRLAAQSSIQQHENLGLRQALIIEQKKRQHGQRLNLIGKEDPGPQLFTPSRVRLALAYLESKDDVEQARKDKIAEKKAVAAAQRTQKALEIASRREQQADAALQRVAAKQVALEERAQKALQRLTKKNALNTLKKEKLAARELEKKARMAKKQALKPTGSVAESVVVDLVEGSISLTIRGRPVRRPKKHDE
jgi:hypothetical protein